MKSNHSNTNRNSTGGNAMTRMHLIFVAFVALTLGACGAENVVDVDGPIPVTTQDGDPIAVSQVNWDPDQCNPKNEQDAGKADCNFDEMCALDSLATAKHGMELYRCVTVCHAEFKTVKFEDGTSEVVKTEDSCQRFGDENWYCDMDLADPECTEYVAVPTTPTPVDPEPTPASPVFVEVSCCFNTAHLTDTMYAQLAWSTSSPDEPENFGKDGDLELDANGCFVSQGKVELSKLYLGFWTELTDGKVQGLDANGDVVYGQWLGNGSNGEYAPTSCTVDGESVAIGQHMPNCGFGFDDAEGVSCLN